MFSGVATKADTSKGEPVYLNLAMTPDNVIRMKPQNLVTGLPIGSQESAIGYQ